MVEKWSCLKYFIINFLTYLKILLLVFFFYLNKKNEPFNNGEEMAWTTMQTKMKKKIHFIEIFSATIFTFILSYVMHLEAISFQVIAINFHKGSFE